MTVLAALPLASTGALGLLWVFGFPLSMPALIGLLMLVGIVTKNSILAMTAGMLPIAMDLEGDGSFRKPMGLVVIGGLITSTVLSLIVVPVVFEVVDAVKARVMAGRAPSECLKESAIVR